MSTHSLRYLRTKLAPAVAQVAESGDEVIITDGDKEVAVIISMTAYERLHEHADSAAALRMRTIRAGAHEALTLEQVRDVLGGEPAALRPNPPAS